MIEEKINEMKLEPDIPKSNDTRQWLGTTRGVNWLTMHEKLLEIYWMNRYQDVNDIYQMEYVM